MMKAGTRRGPNQYRRTDDPLFSEVLSFLEQSARSRRSAGAKRKSSETVNCGRRRHCASAKRRQSIVLALLLVGVGAIAFMFYRDFEKNRQLANATAEYQRLSTESQSAQSRLRELEAEQAKLKSEAAAATATSAGAGASSGS